MKDQSSATTTQVGPRLPSGAPADHEADAGATDDDLVGGTGGDPHRLTAPAIAAALERARAALCDPGDRRCLAFPYSPLDAAERTDAEGWAPIGWLTGRDGREFWDAHLNTRTGTGRLRRMPAPV